MVSYVVPEAIIVIKDIFRRYPGKYEGIIPTLCEHLDALEEPEAKAAMIWIVGQFADKIDNADELLEDLLFTFKEDPVEVQLALLTAAVKLFIYKSQSDATKELVHKVLKWATEEVDNPDLRDRGFMYWRLLAINPAVAGEIILADKPAITTDSDRMDRGALDQLLLHTGTLGSIYHKNPETFIRNAAGKALVDSPALNAHSRAVLIPLSSKVAESTNISVAGPGPAETHLRKSSPLPINTSKAPPPIPTESSSESKDLLDLDEAASPDVDDDDLVPSSTSDPYSNIDGAFGNYMADEPQPMVAGKGSRRDLDDLLF